MNRTARIVTVAALGLLALAASCAMGSVAHAAGVPVASLIHELLTSFYGNHGGIRHLLLAFYRRQQPGMPASWYGPYVRSLIIHYPHAMAACMHSLPHGSAAGCP